MKLKMLALIFGGVLLFFAACKKEEVDTATPPNQNTETVEAAFEADATFALKGTAIQFTDKSTGNPTSWNWTFSGGTPTTSSEKNPIITYAQAGIHAVTLEVSNENSTDQLSRDDFIEILEEAPQLTDDQVFIVNEAAALGEVVAEVQHNFSSPQGLKFEILPSDDATSWSINESNGAIAVSSVAALDFESSKKEYEIEVKVSLEADANYFDMTTVKLEIENADERPTQDLITFMPLDGTPTEMVDNYNPINSLGNVKPTTNRMDETEKAMYFNHNNGSCYLALLSRPGFKNLQEFTVGFWINFDDVAAHGHPMAMYDWADSEQYQMELKANPNGLDVGFYFDTDNYANATSNTTINDNQWYHLVVRWDGTRWDFYLDGQKLVTTNGVGSNLTFPTIDSPGMLIGQWDWSNTNFYGKMDEIRIHASGLSDDEILGWFQEELSFE